MRRALIRSLVAAYGRLSNHQVLELPFVHSLWIHSYFFYKRYFEDPFARLVAARPELFTGGHVLDVGANIGYTAVVFARRIESGFKVFAFEPEVENFNQLTRIVARFQVADRVVANRLAVGSHDGTAELWFNPVHPGDHRTVTDTYRQRIKPQSIHAVPMVSIDSFVRSRPIDGPIRFVKIDVQGYETAVCEGMERTLEANRDLTVVVEYCPSSMIELGINPSSLVDFFRQRGFRLYHLGRGDRLQLLEGEPHLESGGWTDLLCSRSSL